MEKKVEKKITKINKWKKNNWKNKKILKKINYCSLKLGLDFKFLDTFPLMGPLYYYRTS